MKTGQLRPPANAAEGFSYCSVPALADSRLTRAGQLAHQRAITECGLTATCRAIPGCAKYEVLDIIKTRSKTKVVPRGAISYLFAQRSMSLKASNISDRVVKVENFRRNAGVTPPKRLP